jgi:hypothetical protein
VTTEKRARFASTGAPTSLVDAEPFGTHKKTSRTRCVDISCLSSAGASPPGVEGHHHAVRKHSEELEHLELAGGQGLGIEFHRHHAPRVRRGDAHAGDAHRLVESVLLLNVLGRHEHALAPEHFLRQPHRVAPSFPP